MSKLQNPGTSCLATITLSLRDEIHSPAEAELKLALWGFTPGNYPIKPLALQGRKTFGTRIPCNPWEQWADENRSSRIPIPLENR